MGRRTGYTAIIERAFKGLDAEAIDMLRLMAIKKRYPPNTVLCVEGDPADMFYVITDGRVIITRDLEGTDENFVLGYLTDGEYFGEMGIITEEPRGATVTTIVETDVLEISKEDFDKVFGSSPSMARNILNTMIRIIRETDTRAIEDLEKRVEELRKAYLELEAAQADRIAKAALEAQLDVAAKAQRSLLPTTVPQVPGFEFAAYFEPARQVGGDFYDLHMMDSGEVSILLADVSDKGAHAALFMAVARTLFLTETKYHTDPVEVMMAVHEGLIASSTYDMFVTALYGVLNPETGTFSYVRGGHDEPLYVHNEGTAEYLGGSGRFLGLIPEIGNPFEKVDIQMKPGDCFVIYSDGVTDMRNAEGVSYGTEALANLVCDLRRHDAEAIASSIYEHVQAHRGDAIAFDDFSLLVIKAL